MKKRIVAFFLLLVALMMVATSALAATKSDKLDFGEQTSFLVKTDKDDTHKVKLTFEKKSLTCNTKSYKLYGIYQVIVYYKNSAGNYKWDYQTTCWNVGSKTLNLSRDKTDYKIVVKAKTESVVYDSYYKYDLVGFCPSPSYFCWTLDDVPKVKIEVKNSWGTAFQ